jgi:tetratricopeptide (TPR) repeat protein
MMRQLSRNTVLLCILICVGCGAGTQSNQTAGRRSIGRGNPYFERGNIYLRKKQYHKAIEQYRQAVRLEPDSAIIHAALGWAYYNVGMIDAAIAEGEAVMRLEPDHPDVPKLMEVLRQLRR